MMNILIPTRGPLDWQGLLADPVMDWTDTLKSP